MVKVEASRVRLATFHTTFIILEGLVPKQTFFTTLLVAAYDS